MPTQWVIAYWLQARQYARDQEALWLERHVILAKTKEQHQDMINRALELRKPEWSIRITSRLTPEMKRIMMGDSALRKSDGNATD